MDWSNATSISGFNFSRGVVHKFYAFSKQLMGLPPHIYACIQINEVEMPFIKNVGS